MRVGEQRPAHQDDALRMGPDPFRRDHGEQRNHAQAGQAPAQQRGSNRERAELDNRGHAGRGGRQARHGRVRKAGGQAPAASRYDDEAGRRTEAEQRRPQRPRRRERAGKGPFVLPGQPAAGQSAEGAR